MTKDNGGPAATKKILRNRLTQARKNLTATERERQNIAVADRCAKLVQEYSADQIAAYHPLSEEPGGLHLLPALAQTAKTVLLPISAPAGEMLWSPYDASSPLAPGQLNVPEPTGPRRDWRALLECRIMFLPALGSNSRGFRLGKGAGYYDRTLALLAGSGRPVPLLAAVLFDGEVTEDVPVESHDMPVDLIVTAAALHRV
ncbi:MAG TPA: 5-formyltetrahydrofolate cyclo-ligase [Corynebacterium sp.]|nr:5-formyltetrahydrofolate cyclo-ligase [Corynebacterium sp.]